MKRKLIKRNKARVSLRLKHILKSRPTPLSDRSIITHDSISQIKQRGQSCHQKRLARQKRMNRRQIKKQRQKQLRSGLLGSSYGGISKAPLRPASAILIKSTNFR